MGLSSHLHDASGSAPLPLLLLASAASSLSSLFSPTAAPSSAVFSYLGSGFAALVALADQLATSPTTPVSAAAAAAADCTVCLSAMAEGELVRTLACRHVFHAACLDGWFDQSHLSCPLCQAAPAPPEDVASIAGADAAAWFSRF